MDLGKASLTAAQRIEFVNGEALIPDPWGLGRHVSEVILLKGDHYYGGKLSTVNERTIDELCQAFDLLTEDGWYPPVCVNHDLTSGERHGDMFAVYPVHSDELRALVAWNDKDAKRKIETRQWADTSVGIYTIEHARTGLLLTLPLEVSRVTVPHMHTTDTLIQFSGRTAVENDDMTLAETLQSILTRLSALEGNKPKEDEKPAENEEMDEDEEAIMAALKGDEADEMLSARVIPESVRDNLRALYSRDPAKAKALAAKFPAAPKAPRTLSTKAPVTAPKVIKLEEVETLAAQADMDPLAFVAKCEKDGITIKGL